MANDAAFENTEIENTEIQESELSDVVGGIITIPSPLPPLVPRPPSGCKGGSTPFPLPIPLPRPLPKPFPVPSIPFDTVA